MIITATAIDALRVGFSTRYQNAFDAVQSQRDKVSEEIPSTGSENIYGWLGDLPGVREWAGRRVIHGLAEKEYRIKNVPYELTISVPRDKIEDDELGTFAPRFKAMGTSMAQHPEKLVWNALKNGFTAECYDGQSFFDTDHPVVDENGDATTVANTDGGAGAPWFLLCTNEVVKPIVVQPRKRAEFVALDKPTDPNVFFNKEYVYGSDSRWGAGYSFWQLAWGSKQALDASRYAAARTALSGMKKDGGEPMGLTPNLLVVGPSNEEAARKLLNSENAAGGETNPWKGTAELLVVSWLA